jgi:hypothetical protein
LYRSFLVVLVETSAKPAVNVRVCAVSVDAQANIRQRAKNLFFIVFFCGLIPYWYYSKQKWVGLERVCRT